MYGTGEERRVVKPVFPGSPMAREDQLTPDHNSVVALKHIGNTGLYFCLSYSQVMPLKAGTWPYSHFWPVIQ